jgi:magnesium-transporting ATPase (P-type)
MMEKKTIIRTVDACEKMSQIDTICADITGLVTEDLLELDFIWNLE